jgi:hypothetical protein
VKKNNNAASAKDELRRALLRDAEELAFQWEIRIEDEEAAEEKRLRLEAIEIESLRSWRDDERDQEMFDLATRKLRNEQVLRYLDNMPQIGRPPARFEEYRQHRLEALRAFPHDEAAAKKRFRLLSKAKPSTARNVWRILKREEKNKSAR